MLSPFIPPFPSLAPAPVCKAESSSSASSAAILTACCQHSPPPSADPPPSAAQSACHQPCVSSQNPQFAVSTQQRQLHNAPHMGNPNSTDTHSKLEHDMLHRTTHLRVVREQPEQRREQGCADCDVGRCKLQRQHSDPRAHCGAELQTHVLAAIEHEDREHRRGVAEGGRVRADACGGSCERLQVLRQPWG
eukprot:1353227-Rhodomonas_salina.2